MDHGEHGVPRSTRRDTKRCQKTPCPPWYSVFSVIHSSAKDVFKHNFAMRIIIPIILSLLTNVAFSQTDSCKIQPFHTASFEGVHAKGMINYDNISKLHKMISDEDGTTILRFTVSIDCDACELYTREVYGDTLSVEDIKLMTRRESRYIISFDCITGKTKKGEIISHKPFLYYIKP
jgi:hypothetical protein